MARFEIEDSGPGMSADELERVFEPFARGSASGGAASGSTGLGLTIARMLTGLMGGELTVTSQPGMGTTFCVRLFLPEMSGEPRGLRVFEAERAGASAQVGLNQVSAHGFGATAAANELVRLAGQGPHQPATTPLPAIGDGRRILCVDNEETDRRLLVDLLVPLGFVIEQADSGEAALARLHGQAEADRPHAILLDLAMPGIDGWTTLARLRDQDLSRAPVAIVSANAFDKLLLAESVDAPRSAAAALQLPGRGEIGVADFFVKPVRVAELVDWLLRRVPAPAAVVPVSPSSMSFAFAPTPIVASFSAAIHAPAPERLQALRAAVDLGHVRGVLTQLDALEAEAPAWAGFVAQARTLARQFQLGAMDALLARAMKETPLA
jgi:CheY-like chemotaxis protein